jgi:transposase
MIGLYARSPRGQRAIGDRPQRRGKNVSMVEALSLGGPIATLQVLGPMDGLTFDAYLIQRVIPNLWPGACVLMDNSSTHITDEEIETALAEVGADLIKRPPYSPDFSPIENFWSKVKNTSKSLGARTYQALEDAIEFAYSQVSLEDIHNWFTYCCYCTSPN